MSSRIAELCRRSTIATVASSLALVLALGQGTAFAQLTTGTIEGVIEDETGGILPGVTVEITNVDTGATRSLVTNQRGRYSAPNLQVGPYEVRARLEGFGQALRRGISLTVGRVAVVDLRLGVAQSEELVVLADAPLIETTTATVSNLVSEADVQELPTINRDLTQLAFLQPGVVKSPAGEGVFSGQGTKLSVAGARGTQNLYLLDGVSSGDISGNPQGVSGVLNGSETIKEMQIITNNYSAEYRSAVGAIVSAVTKSGTNQVHGSAFGFFRNDALNAANFFDEKFGNEEPDLNRKHFGGSLGGPIVRDRAFFFVSYEGLREDLGFTDTIRVPSVDARQGILSSGTVAVHPTSATILNLYPVPGQGNQVVSDDGDTVLIAGTTNRTTRNNFAVAKLDFILDQRNNVSLTYNFDRGNRDNLGLIPGDSTTFGAKSRTQIVSGKWTTMPSNTAVNELHVGYSDTQPQGDLPLSDQDWQSLGLVFRQDRDLFGEVATGEVDSIGFRVGGSSFRVRSLTVKDAFTWNAGDHSVRFGGEFTHYKDDVFTCSRGCQGNWTFRNLRDLVRGRARRFEMLLPGGDITDKDLTQNMLAAYVQDDWRASDKLTLNIGLRYEYASRIDETNGNSSQIRSIEDADVTVGPFYDPPPPTAFSPRVGFVWTPDDGRSSLRGGFGIFYEHVNLFLMRTALAELPPFTLVGRIDDNRTPNGIDWPNAGFTQIDLASGRPNVRGFQYDQKQTYSTRFSLTYQRQIGASHVTTIDYTGSRGYNLWGQNLSNLNRWEGYPNQPPEGTPKFWPEGAGLINPNFGEVRIQNPNQRSWYNGLSVGLQRVARDGLRYGFAFTWSKAIDQGSGVTSGGEEFAQSQRGIYGYDLQLKQGLAAFHRSKAFTAHLSWEPPWGKDGSGFGAALARGWQVNAILTALDGYPLTALDVSEDQIDRIGDNEDLRPDLIPGGNPNPVTGDPDRWFDTSQFTPSQLGYFGTLGRNTIIAPGSLTLDVSLFRNIDFGSARLQLRAEAFNVTNRTNFGAPSMTVFQDGELDPDAGRITRTSTPARRVQLGARLIW